MTATIDKHLPKPRRRPCVRGHKGIERGSTDAARLFWADADVISQATGADGYAKLPETSRYGFASQPMPPDKASRAIFDAWYHRERERDRASFMKLTDEQRAKFYWGAVDHCSMGDGVGPDAYVFGYDEIPTRPAEYPEPDLIREIREIRAGVAERQWLTVLGLSWPYSVVDVRRAYRRLALVRHPDRGGNAEAFDALTKARDAALLAIA